ncbi:MAB_1171c family putative transporter [Streptomyces sp. NPDC005791]|uniref:MAB_1171c family putative transporter n=1 Tax=Streptomyces sp. NPDC005791 TaxID=3364732 RepID=UPI0036BC7DBA
MISLIPAALLWVVTAWRAPAAWRVSAKRPLWVAFFALSIAMTIRPDSIATAVDAWLRINNLATLFKHLAGIAAAYAVLMFVHDVAQEQAKALRNSRLHIAVPLIAGASLILLFFAAPLPSEATDLLTDFADDWRIATYGVIWSGYLGAALVSATRLCWQWGRLPGTGLLGRGLQLTGLGTALGICYAGHRVLALALRFFDVAPLTAQADERISNIFLFGALVFILAGSTLPAARRLRRWGRAHLALVRLYPLWLDLTAAVPSVRLDPPRSRRSDALHFRRTRDRLYRRGIEIRDAILDLGDHASPALRSEAASYVAEKGLVGAQAGIYAEACWLVRAKAAREHGDARIGEHTSPASGGQDLHSEVEALKHLATAYESAIVLEFASARKSG